MIINNIFLYHSTNPVEIYAMRFEQSNLLLWQGCLT